MGVWTPNPSHLGPRLSIEVKTGFSHSKFMTKGQMTPIVEQSNTQYMAKASRQIHFRTDDFFLIDQCYSFE